MIFLDPNDQRIKLIKSNHIYIYYKLKLPIQLVDRWDIPPFRCSFSPRHGLRVALHVGADLLPGLVVHVRQAADLHLGAVADLPGPVQCMEFHEMTKREIMGL